jgi:hypothetical protein
MNSAHGSSNIIAATEVSGSDVEFDGVIGGVAEAGSVPEVIKIGNTWPFPLRKVLVDSVEAEELVEGGSLVDVHLNDPFDEFDTPGEACFLMGWGLTVLLPFLGGEG